LIQKTWETVLMKLQNVEKKDHFLKVNISGTFSRFHYFWLRDNCPDCRSANGQKLHESNLLDRDVNPVSINYSDEELVIDWSDHSQSVFPVSFLQKWRYDNVALNQSRVVLWDKSIQDKVVRHDYETVCNDEVALKRWLRDVADYGFGLLKNVPAVEEKIFDVVGLFGFVRETNYGKLFEVRAQENASNLAYTPLPLSVHTDNPYRDPCPSLQLLHCLVQADQGGLTVLSDGFYAANKLRQEAPSTFALLSEQQVAFHYESDDAVLDNSDPIISLASDGSFKKIRINNRSISPLHIPFEQMLPFYDGLFEFRSILESEENQFRFRLQPGDLLLLDNERVLHGRAGKSTGTRHLQGCYADRDGLLSTLKVLERNE
jgi:gamma-butyrobetaine hydroxylase